MTVLNFPDPNDKSGDWKLLEEKSINDRTILVWYDSKNKISSLAIFNVNEQPNEVSKKSSYTTWGFLTYYATSMHTLQEASEVVSLFLQDMEKGSYWWELIN